MSSTINKLEYKCLNGFPIILIAISDFSRRKSIPLIKHIVENCKYRGDVFSAQDSES